MFRLPVTQWVAAPLLFLLSFWLVMPTSPNDFGTKDLIAFWAGARVFFSGGDPYDPHQLEFFYQSLSFPVEYHQVYWNPPWAFSFFWLFQLLPFTVLAGAFILLNSAAIVSSARLSFSLVKNGEIPKLSIIIFFVSFYPMAFAVAMGQLTALLLLCLCWAVPQAVSPSRRRRFASGLVLSLSLLKPHLVFLILLILALHDLRERKTWIFGFLTGFAVQAGLPLLVRGDVYQLYSQSTFPTFYFNPTLGAWLQSLAPNLTFLRFLPAILAIGVFLILSFTRFRLFLASPTTLLTLVLPLNLIVAPYSWTYDYLLLLPAAVCILGTDGLDGRLTKVALLAANLGLCFGPVEMKYTGWYPIVLLLLALKTHFSAGQSKVARGIETGYSSLS